MSVIKRSLRRVIDLASGMLSPDAKRRLGRWDVARRLVAWSRDPVAVATGPSAGGEADDTVDVEAVEVPIELMGSRPSYRYKLEELKRRRQWVLHEYGLRDPLSAINDKYRAYEFADLHGVDHPKVFGAYRTIEEVEWTALPDAFVLKTRWGSSNIGVKALVRQSGHRFVDLLRSRTWTIDEMLEDQHRKQAEGLVSRSLFAEELIRPVNGDGIADDWKFYCFYGQVGLSMQRDVRASADQSQWRFKFRGRDWNDLGPVKFVDRLDPSLPDPEDPEGLLALAEELSTLIRRPFIRIDLFESQRGPLLGEFTPAPGPPEVFTSEVDEMLGWLWERAEVRQFAESIVSGHWSNLEV